MLSLHPRVKDLIKLLPEYQMQRDKGMDAGHLAEKLNMPLKDVISFLTEEDILVEGQVDLELFRVFVRKNPDAKTRLIENLGISTDVLDSLLLTSDETVVGTIWQKRQQTRLMPLFNGFMFFFFAAKLPFYLILLIMNGIVCLLIAQLYLSERPPSARDLVLKALKET